MKKPAVLFILFTFLVALADAQESTEKNGMEVSRYNFTTFHPERKNITETLQQHTPYALQQHPEFGILPFKAGCSDCVELLQHRTLNSRYFIQPDNRTRFFVQQSYSPLHYFDAQKILRTIDPRLKPVAAHPGVYSATSQPVPTQFNAHQHETSIITPGLTFNFNRNLKVYYLDNAGNKLHVSNVDFTNTSVGENGALTKNAWENIDLRQVFLQSGVETDFILQRPLNIPQSAVWLVFEDEFKLPEGFNISKTNGTLLNETYWSADLVIEAGGRRFIDLFKPKYYDSGNIRSSGFYSVEKNDERIQLKVLVPVAFLSSAGLQYPVYIDPLVVGRDSLGQFIQTPVAAGAALAFSNDSIGCEHTLNVSTPAKSTLLDALVDVEYLTSDSFCVASPPAVSPFCYFMDLTLEVVGPCSSTGVLTCSPSNPPFIGVCTTDPDKVPRAGALRFTNFLECVPFSCNNYLLPFTLRNRSLQCTESCGYNCATGSFFAVTVEGILDTTLQADLIPSVDSITSGAQVALAVLADYGTPPYSFSWTPGGSADSVFQAAPAATTVYTVVVTDACGATASNSATVYVTSNTSIRALSDQLAALDIYPNPFSSFTTVQFSLRQDAAISVRIYDLLGKTVFIKNSTAYAPGIHKMELQNADLPVGLFIIELDVNGVKTRRRLTHTE